MFARVREFFARHPALVDAMRWVIPALIFGAVLRGMLLSYQPYAYWGSDSSSYFGFVYKLMTYGDISLDEKRRFLYPIMLVPISLLPGVPLMWLAWFQHAFGLLTLIPLAYVIRKTMTHWRWVIIPITALYAGFPIVLWYEHELLGENIFFALILWAFAGWTAWMSTPDLARAKRLFWLFFIPFVLFILTKPTGRFVWPGLGIGWLICAGWRRTGWKQYLALVILMGVTLCVGSKKQGSWLLYVATFPLTDLDSPKHADYKAEIRGKVEELRENICEYYGEDEWAFNFLRVPSEQKEWPLWSKLRDGNTMGRLYLDLATEGIKSNPGLFFRLGLERLVFSANVSQFKEERFDSERAVKKLAVHYGNDAKSERSDVRLAFGLPRGKPTMTYEEFAPRLAPHPNSWAENTVRAYVHGYQQAADLFRWTSRKNPEAAKTPFLSGVRLTGLGWWLLVSMVLSLLPKYRPTLGIWMIVASSYLIGVFLISQVNPRYFGLAWPLLVPLLAIPVDLILSRVWKPMPQA